MNLNSKIPSSPEEWDILVIKAQAQRSLNGFNNYNYVVHIGGEAWVKIRVPIPNRDEMDLRLLPENLIQKYLYDNNMNVPNVIHVSDKQLYQIQEYLPVPVVDDLFPRGSKLPQYFISDIVEFYSKLFELPFDWLQPYLKGWVTEGNTDGFFEQILMVTDRIYEKYFPHYHELYNQLGIPEAPVTKFRQFIHRLKHRPFAICHSDIHRKNCLLVENTIWVIDWELALIGDPCYDISVHLSKMLYQPEEEEYFLELISKKINNKFLNGFYDDYNLYKNHEYFKSVIVDTIRYHKLISNKQVNDETFSELSLKLERKLAKAEPVIGCKGLKAQEIYKLFLNYKILN